MENMALIEKIVNKEYLCHVMLFGNKDDMRKIREYELYLTKLNNLVYTPVFSDDINNNEKDQIIEDINKRKCSMCDGVIIVSDKELPEMLNIALEINKPLIFTNWEMTSLNRGVCYFNMNKDFPLYMLKEN